MRWLTTLATVAGLGVLGHIMWNAQGPALLEKLHLDFLLPADAEPSMDVETLIEMCQNDTFTKQLDWKVEAKLNRPAFASYGSVDTTRAFIGGDVTDAEARAAMTEFQNSIALAAMGPATDDSSSTHRRASTQQKQPAHSQSNQAQSDYKRIPRMQQYGLSNIVRYGSMNPFGKRTLFNQTRFAQQQSELDRLRGRRDNHVGGRVVVNE